MVIIVTPSLHFLNDAYSPRFTDRLASVASPCRLVGLISLAAAGLWVVPENPRPGKLCKPGERKISLNIVNFRATWKSFFLSRLLVTAQPQMIWIWTCVTAQVGKFPCTLRHAENLFRISWKWHFELKSNGCNEWNIPITFSSFFQLFCSDFPGKNIFSMYAIMSGNLQDLSVIWSSVIKERISYVYLQCFSKRQRYRSVYEKEFTISHLENMLSTREMN